jgi:hypothetical protein
VIRSLNAHFKNFHFKDILADHNLLASHILCFNETKIRNIDQNKEIKQALWDKFDKFDILSCYDEHGTMVFYDNFLKLLETTNITNTSAEVYNYSFQ